MVSSSNKDHRDRRENRHLSRLDDVDEIQTRTLQIEGQNCHWDLRWISREPLVISASDKDHHDPRENRHLSRLLLVDEIRPGNASKSASKIGHQIYRRYGEMTTGPRMAFKMFNDGGLAGFPHDDARIDTAHQNCPEPYEDG